MNTLLCIAKEGGYREDMVKKIEQVGFKVHSCEPQAEKTLEEAKRLKPEVLVLDFSESAKETKLLGQVGKELSQEFRGIPLYLVNVGNQQKERIKILIRNGKFVEEKSLYRIIKTHVSASATASSTESSPTEEAPSTPAKTTPEPPVQKLEKVKETKKGEKTEKAKVKEIEKVKETKKEEKTPKNVTPPAKKDESPATTKKDTAKKEPAPKKKEEDSAKSSKSTASKKGKK